MAIQSINSNNTPNRPIMNGFHSRFNGISYGYMNLESREYLPKATLKDKILAGTGSVAGISIATLAFMKHQKVKNSLKLKYDAKTMLAMAGSANLGGILLSSIGEHDADIKKKWKEGAFQMMLTTAPMVFIDGAIKLCEKYKKFNNNFVKIIASVVGVTLGTDCALALSNKLRSEREAKKAKREIKLIDMIANLDDAVAILVLAKLPFADKIHAERLLPFIYSFCGYRSGTGDRRS